MLPPKEGGRTVCSRRIMSSIKVSHYKIRISDPMLRPQQPFSIAVLADLHNTVIGEQNETLLQEIREADPKAVLSAGDMVLAKAKNLGIASAVALLGELTRRYPVYCVNGNHETRMEYRQEVFGDAYEKYTQKIRSLGVRVLRNSGQFIEINRTKLALYGYEMDWKYYGHGRRQKMPAEEIREALGEPAEGAYRILLAHNPDYFSAYAQWGADLTLSGHLHGGMVRLPKIGGLISPNWTLFPKYDHGLYTIEEKKMIVSAGLGSHTIKLRINNPPELVVLDFV